MGIQEELHKARKQWKQAQKKGDKFMTEFLEEQVNKLLKEMKRRMK